MRRALVLATCLTLATAGSAFAAPPPAPPSGTTDVFTFSSARGRLGLVVIGLTDELKQFYGAGKDGVLIGKVEPSSPAAKAGVQVGDVLADVDGKPVDEAGDVLALLGGKKKDAPVALTIVRNHLPLLLTARLAADAPAFDMLPRAFDDLRDLSFGDIAKRLDQLEQRMHDLDHK